MKNKYFYISASIFCFGLIAADLISKYHMQSILRVEDIVIIKDFLKLQLHFNSGIAFSIPVPQILQITSTSLLLCFLIWLAFFRFQDSWQQAAFLAIIAGGIGNLYERIIFGQVTDFIAIWHFPVFNLADTWITCGVGLWLITQFWEEKTKE